MGICVLDGFQPLEMYQASKIKKNTCFHLRMSNTCGKHLLKGSDARVPRLESWSQWWAILINSLEAIEVESGHVPALRSHLNQF